MSDNINRSTKAATIYLAILDVMDQVKKTLKWDDEDTYLAIIDALSNHLCVVGKFCELTKDEIVFGIQDKWNKLEDLKLDVDPLKDLIDSGNGETN